jgi:hypothetical protein
MGALLFYGPGARASALAEADARGRLLVPPAGDDGLKVEEARQISRLLISIPIGDKIGVVVVGPMDLMTPKVSDTLLKALEDHPQDRVCPILWADDLEEVSETIRSRCSSSFSDINSPEEGDPLYQEASDLFTACQEGNVLHIIQGVQRGTGQEKNLILYLAAWSEIYLEEGGLEVWEKIRPLCKHRNPSQMEILSALLPEKVR